MGTSLCAIFVAFKETYFVHLFVSFFVVLTFVHLNLTYTQPPIIYKTCTT